MSWSVCPSCEESFTGEAAFGPPESRFSRLTPIQPFWCAVEGCGNTVMFLGDFCSWHKFWRWRRDYSAELAARERNLISLGVERGSGKTI